MIRDQLEAEIVAANETITRTQEGNFDPTYKEFWVAAQKNHIKICQGEIAALDKLLNGSKA